MIRRIYSDPPETISVIMLTESGNFAHGQCCVGLALPNTFLSGRNRLPAKQGIFLIRQKFAEIARFEFGISRETADFLDFP